MKSLALFASISRLHIVAIAALGTFTFGWVFTGQHPWLIAAVSALDWFLVNLLNRVVDIPEDRANQGLIRPQSVEDNIALANLKRLTRGIFVDAARVAAEARSAIQRFGIRARGPGQPVRQLSGGNQQKVVLGKWLATNPRILIMDEPTRGIDVGAKAEIHQLMRRLAGEGMAILMISSELPEVLGMSDRVLVMNGGRIVGEFDKGHATAEAVGTVMTRSMAREDAA